MKENKLLKVKIKILTFLLLLLPLLGYCQEEDLVFMRAMDIKELKLEPEQLKIVDKINDPILTNAVFGLSIGDISEVLQSTKGSLPIILPGYPEVIRTAQRTFEFFSENDYKWSGEFEGFAGDFLIRCNNGEFRGQISIGDKVYQFRTLFKEKCILIEKNTDRLNHLGDLSPISKGIQETIANQEKTTHVIDVLVLYSENAVDYCDNNNEDIEDNAQDAIDQLQLALDYSVPDDDITIDIAGVEEFSFYENWDSIQWDWDTLKADALSRRNATDADLVVLMTDACPSTHQGWYVNGSFWVAGYAPYYGPDAVNAYAIVDVSFATDNKTFAHEVGHLFGCDHESGTGYNHGYKFTVLPPKASGKASTNYRTLMHTPYTGYTRIDRFSNPDVSYSGEDIGVENSYDNARKIENTAGSLKNYRPFAKGTQSPSSQEGGNPRNNVFNSKVEIYPNPLSESTTIRYSLNEPSYVQIKLLDLTGRVCKTIEDSHQSKGFYNLSVGDVRLKSGVYICSIIIGDNQMKKKLFIK